MDIAKQLLDSSPLDQSRFTQIRDREFKPGYDLTALKYLRDKAGRERDLRELYRGRAPYELLQNADDAKAGKAVFILANDGLVFAHDGNWFTVANFRSLADGWSDKDPNQCIGHKGLGFRSVLDLTPSPHVLRLDAGEFLAIKFTWALNNGHLQEVLNRDHSLRSHYADWAKNGQSICPVMSIPGLAKKQGLGSGAAIYDRLLKGDYRGRYTTMFWLPAADPEVPRKTLEELSPTPIPEDTLHHFLKNEVSILLPFLQSIKEVYLYRVQTLVTSVILKSTTGERDKGVVSVITEDKGSTHTRAYFQMRFSFPIPANVSADAETPKAVKAMKKAGITLSVRLTNDQPVADEKSHFHVYFPTNEHTGLGFVIHGDFYVKPDRTRLMTGAYNTWLLSSAAQRAANEFLTELINNYDTSKVFSSLTPNQHANGEGAAGVFISAFSEALSKRKTPFIPSQAGWMRGEETVLPPTQDSLGFWNSHFSEVIDLVLTNKRGFILPSVDSKAARAFLRIAQVKPLNSEQLLDFIEAAGRDAKPMEWWYECYDFMSNEENLLRRDHSYFSGRKLIPTGEQSVIPVSAAGTIVVCLPPRGDTSGLHVPKCFSRSFVFVNPDLAHLLDAGRDTVRSWILNRFRIARFEASELLPRAVRSVSPKLYSGELTLSRAELKELWAFVFRVIQLSRVIEGTSFWDDIGRLPIPVAETTTDETMPGQKLAPAFLLYWPDGYTQTSRCMEGASGLRRVDEGFINQLVEENEISRADWIDFFTKAGVSGAPKLLEYSRVVAADPEIPFAANLVINDGPVTFSGERQRDQNRVVVNTLASEEFLQGMVRNAPQCEHKLPRVLQSLKLIEGLEQVTRLAQREFETGDERWSQRLWSLIRALPLQKAAGSQEDSVFCRGGRGHSAAVGRYVNRQLNNYKWLPSTQGPAARNACFARHSARRLIATGASGDEIGDKLLPYVVVDDFNDSGKLQLLGVETLDDAASASTRSLMRALTILGERLSTDWGHREILSERSRWRLVRGAIQDIYRTLNQRFGAQPAGNHRFAPRTKFAGKEGGKVKFTDGTMFYARPGSPVELAFRNTLTLFDADRPYPSLFSVIGVTQLVSGDSVVEHFDSATNFTPAGRLADEVRNRIAPLLLALVVSQSGRNQCEPIVRRLDRLDVRAVSNLKVSFSLRSDPQIKQTIEFPHFHLQRQLTSSASGGREAHFILYVRGTGAATVAEVDADRLGELLATVFDDAASAETQGMFARIVARYKSVNGTREEMEEYLYSHLGISHEAQDTARAIICGEDTILTPLTPAPPPARVHRPAPSSAGQQTNINIKSNQPLADSILRHKTQIDTQTQSFVSTLVSPSKPSAGGAAASPSPADGVGSPITPEQSARGLRGEEEIKRRLQLPGGWEGFTLIEDTRDKGCGYDFLCALDGREVALEIKTFTPEGRIFVTSRELQEASAKGKDYFLIGVLDEGTPPHSWTTDILQDPVGELLIKGDFVMQPTLKLNAADLFKL